MTESAEADATKADGVLPTSAPSSASSSVPPSQASKLAGMAWPWLLGGVFVLALAAVGTSVLAWSTQQRVKALEVELVKRQQDSANQANEARTLARQAEAVAREAGARVALLDARVAETSLQRTQLEDLVQSMARSRDENMLADIDNALRVALQQSGITGSVEPLVQTLRQADDRLARHNQPRLEQVRRAVAQDLDRVLAAGASDVGVLTLRLDELIRLVDDLPLASQSERRTGRAVAAAGISASAVPAVPVVSAASAAAAASAPLKAASATGAAVAWGGMVGQQLQALFSHVWVEVKGLVRVTRIEDPEAMLLSPDQAWFMRENLKLRLLNARLALLSRQFDTAQLDLRDAQTTLNRYFDRSARRVQQGSELLKQVASEARAVSVPRPDATLAAITTATAGR